ncbi:PREDICTED: (RS)-norcoclaurine 6-O-methyltransferase-like [Ipomoea nil]|uniref:(RS)-norcoclaurine 6-O-methyltransferase-like n=1 Tax=Ipomoea nil TaxID=35883 RepID=UPI000901803B|nr:PREDICTED: (RS)-norcoclaurine 6-O-methyltransferase-like [Ipomoea nil]
MDAKSIRRQEVDYEEEDGIWKYVFGFTEMAVVKCAIELGIPDFLESQEQAVTLDQLSSGLGCSPSALYRIMRFLINRGIFKEVEMTLPTISSTSSTEAALASTRPTRGYVQTPLSALLTRDGEKSMAAFVRLESSPVMLAPWLKLSGRVLLGDNNNHKYCSGSSSDAFEAANGKDVWRYAESDPAHSKLIEDAMACHARMAVPAIVQACPDLLLLHGAAGVECVVVDVGGGDGTTVEMLVKAFPGVKGINFDLPHVVSVAPKRPGVHHVGGNMFQRIPKADAIFLMWVLHDWGDEECVQILSKCREAIPEETGKVIIAEAILRDHQEMINGYQGTRMKLKNNTNTKNNSKLQEKDRNNNNNNSYEVGLMLDMVMMAHTGKGLERTEKQWSHVLTAAGFKSYTVTDTSDVVSIIQARP